MHTVLLIGGIDQASCTKKLAPFTNDDSWRDTILHANIFSFSSG